MPSPTDEQRSISSAIERQEASSQRLKRFRPTKSQKVVVPVVIMAITLLSLAYAGFLQDRRGSEAAPGDLSVSTKSVSNTTQTSVTLNGNTTPNNVIARGFQYGPDTNYGQTVNDTSTISRVIDKQWGSSGSGDGQFSNPLDIAVDSQGNSYVVDSDQHQIQKFSANGDFITKWGSDGTSNGQFSIPLSLAVDSQANVYVLDGGQKTVQKFDTNGTFIAKWSGFTYSPYGITIDETDNVYVTDYYQVIKYNSSGTQLTTWGSNGSGNGQFVVAYGISSDKNGHIYVADVNNSRIQKFDTSGNFITQWSAAGTYRLAANSSGRVYAQSNLQTDKLYEYSDTGNLLAEWGSYGANPGQIGSVIGLAVTADNVIYTVDSTNRVSTFAAGISATISGLTCNTTYHYRALATSSGGTVYGEDQVFTTNACGTPTPSSAPISSPDPSVSGRIVYAKTTSAYNSSLDTWEKCSDIYSSLASGTDEQQLTHDCMSTSPTVSPDGTKILITLGDLLAVIDINGNILHTYSSITSDDHYFSYSLEPWSSDSRYVVVGFNDYTSDNDGVFKLDTVAGTELRLTTSPDGAYDPNFSPNDLRVVFNVGQNISIVDSDATNPIQLTTDADDPWYTNTHPTFSADSSYVYYASSHNNNVAYDAITYNLWRIGTDGSNKTQLTNFTDIAYASLTPYENASKFMLFAYDTSGQAKILTVDTNGLTLLNSNSFAGAWASFSDPSLDGVAISPNQQHALLSVSAKWNGGSPNEGGLYTIDLANGNVGASHLSNGSNGQAEYYGYVSWLNDASHGLQAPQNLIGTPFTNSVGLKWDNISGVEHYAVEYKASTDNDWMIGHDAYGASALLSGLMPDTSYDFRVAAVNSANQQSSWSTITVRTAGQQTYHITNCAQLQGIFINPYTLEFGDGSGHYILDNDIDCSESANWYWEGLIGYQTSQPFGFLGIASTDGNGLFTGSFDGQGHTVSNIYQDPQGIMGNTGIFAGAMGATFENVTFSNATLKGMAAESNVAQNAGFLGNGAGVAILNVHLTNLAMTTYPGLNGGLVGTLDFGSVINGSSAQGNMQSASASLEGRFGDGMNGAAVDSSGNVYIVDTGNNRVQKFDSNGTFLIQFGNTTIQDRNDYLHNPRAVALDSAGNIYVADTDNNHIRKFDSSGNLISTWGSLGNGDGEFNSPSSIAIGSSNYIYVLDSHNDRVQKFDSGGNYISQWSISGASGGQIAIDNSNAVYVVESNNNRVQKFTSSGTLLTSFGSYGTADGELDGPTGVAVGPNGTIYVVDSGNNRIQQFDGTGAFLDTFGSQGNGDGEFSDPHGIAIDLSNNIYVSDSNNSRVQKFNSSGVFVRQWGVYGQVPYADYSVGGLVAMTDMTENVISESFSDVNISLNIPSYSGSDTIGGLIGMSFATVNNTYTTGNIHTERNGLGDNTQTGGLLGVSIEGSIHNSYSRSHITVGGNYSGAGIGGLIGASVRPISNSFASGEVSGPTFSFNSNTIQPGGLIGMVVNPYNGFPTLTNNFYDRTASSRVDCIGAYLDSATQTVWPAPNSVCTAVNTDNSSPNYFINNASSPPLNTWDFSSIWKTNTTTPPTFLGSEAPTQTVPGAPRSLNANTKTTTSINVSWLAPTSDGNSPISDFVVQYKASSSNTWLAFNDGVNTNLSATITGLTQATSYDFRVAAVNAVGQGPYSTTLATSTLGPPSVPQNLHVSTATQTDVTLAWDTPAMDGGTNITDYTVQYKLTTASSWSLLNDGVDTTLSATVGGLNAGTSYDFRVAAVNAVGQSGWATLANIVTTPPLPSVPRNLAATPYAYSGFTSFNFNNSIAFPRLTWDAPVTGAPITAYTIRYRAQGETSWQDIMVGATPRSYDVDFDINTLYESGEPQDQAALETLLDQIYRGQIYDFQIAATNAVGQGAYSDTVSFKLAVTATDCQLMADNLHYLAQYSASMQAEVSFALVQDINCSDTLAWNNGQGWIPVAPSTDGDMAIFFAGNHHAISNMHMQPPTGLATGMFAVTYNSTFQDTGLLNWNVWGVNHPTGALIGVSYDALSLSGITSNAIVTGNVSGEPVGGLVGGLGLFDSAVNIQNIDLSGELTTGIGDQTAILGGLVGVISKSSNSTADVSLNSIRSNIHLKVDAMDSQVGQNPDGLVGGLIGYAGVADYGDTTTGSTLHIANTIVDNQYNTSCTTTGGMIGGSSMPVDIQSSHSSGDISCHLPSYFDNAQDIAIDPDDNLVAQESGGNIRTIDGAGKFINSWKPTGHSGGEIAIDQDGYLYANSLKFGPDHQPISNTAYHPDFSSHVTAVSDLAVGSNQVLYVADQASNRVVMFDAQSGDWRGEFPTQGSAFTTIEKIALDSDNNIYVSNGDNLIQKFNPSGEPVTAWYADLGENPTDSQQRISGMSTSHGVLYVARGDSGGPNPRIQKFDSTGSYAGIFAAATGNLAADSSGNVYVADKYGHLVYKYASNGTLLQYWLNEKPAGGGSWSAGGLIGVSMPRSSQLSDHFTSISDSSYTGTIIADGSGSSGTAGLGGLVGQSFHIGQSNIVSLPNIDNLDTFRQQNGLVITNSSSNATITTSGFSGFSGGLVGRAASTTVINSHGSADITADITGLNASYFMGGAVGASVLLSSHDSSSSGALLINSAKLFGNSLGGFVGAATGNAEIDNTHSTSTITTQAANSGYDPSLPPAYIMSGTGGLAGVIMNNHLNDTDYPEKNYLHDSYASGKLSLNSDSGSFPYAYATGNGGLVGTLWGDSDISGVHATGDVLTDPDLPQTSAGGLIGLNGLPPSLVNSSYSSLTTINNSYATGSVIRSDKLAVDQYSIAAISMTGTGGLIGANHQSININQSYSSGSVDGPLAGGIIGSGSGNGVLGEPTSVLIDIKDTYAHGNILGRITKPTNRDSLDDPFMRAWFDINSHLNNSSGGIIGSSGALHSLEDSYSSGTISTDNIPLDPDSYAIAEDNPSIAILADLSQPKVGGLVGFNAAMAGTDSTIQNNFSANINLARGQTSSSLVGLTTIFDTTDSSGSINYLAGLMYSNNYFDARSLAVDSNACGYYAVITISETDATNTELSPPTHACKAINTNNSQPNYFINNHTNPPLNTWDFNSVWETNYNTYPDFVGSSAPATPVPTPVPTSTPPITPAPRPSAKQTPAPTPQPSTAAGGTNGSLVTPQRATPSIAPRPTRVSDTTSLLSQLRTAIGHLSPGITYAPGSLILLLIMLAIFYLYQSWREHQAQVKMERLISRFQVTQRLRSDFINITSHYLNTPIQIMGSGIELATTKLAGMKQQIRALEASLKIMSDDIVNVLKASAQLSPPASHVLTSLQAAPERNLLRKPGVWLPVVSTAIMLVVFDLIIIVVGQLGANPYVLGIQICALIFAGLMIVFTYRARSRLRRLTNQTMATLQMEEELDSSRTDFIRQATKQLDQNLTAIHATATELIATGKVPAFANGLGMAEETLLKLKRIEQVTTLPATNVKTPVAPWLNANLPELESFVREAQLTLNAEIDSNIEVALTIDSLAQLVSSLVGNAVKFTQAGGTVTLKLLSQKQGALLIVQDTGTGIEPEKLKTLFQPFTRGTDVLSYDYEGIGLSLYINQLIVARVGGSIDISSKPGRGTKVTVKLPTTEV